MVAMIDRARLSRCKGKCDADQQPCKGGRKGNPGKTHCREWANAIDEQVIAKSIEKHPTDRSDDLWQGF